MDLFRAADTVEAPFLQYSEKIHLQLLDEITTLLQDNVNNFENYITTQQQMWLQQYTQLNVALLQWPFQQQMMDTLFGTNSNSNSNK